jgi:hypothetical protein
MLKQVAIHFPKFSVFTGHHSILHSKDDDKIIIIIMIIIIIKAQEVYER